MYTIILCISKSLTLFIKVEQICNIIYHIVHIMTIQNIDYNKIQINGKDIKHYTLQHDEQIPVYQ